MVSSAAPLTRTASCLGLAKVGAGPQTQICTFELDDTGWYPSRIGTHANFHAKLASGTVSMKWVDQSGATVASWDCDAPGLYVGSSSPTGTNHLDIGVADASTIPNCTQTVNGSVYYAKGLQTLIVTATPTTCVEDMHHPKDCPFHGYLQLNPSSVPF